jgi:hypothetical protein
VVITFTEASEGAIWLRDELADPLAKIDGAMMGISVSANTSL